jgi:molybdopterin-dependent oxidoreductase alpha subunit
MGISESMPEAFLERLGREFGFEPSRRRGTSTVAAIHAMLEGRASVFVAMGGNFLSASPDTEVTARALARCRLTVHVATKLNRAHLVRGRRSLLLPCLGRTERDVQRAGPQFVTVENSMGVVHPSRGHLEPASPQLRSEVAIVAGIGRALFADDRGIDWDAFSADYGVIRTHIERVVDGFSGFAAQLREHGQLELPNAARDRRFDTPSGRALFTVHELPRHELQPGQFLMMTIRSHDQFNTTIYSDDDRYRGIYGDRRVVLLNEGDLVDAGLEEGSQVDIVSHFDGQERVARGFTVVAYPIPRRCAATYFPEANVLVPLDHVADKSGTPASKSVVISLRGAPCSV